MARFAQVCPPEGEKFVVQGEEFESVGRAHQDGRCIFRDSQGQLTVFNVEGSTSGRRVASGTKAALVIGGLVALTALVEHGID